MHWARGAAGAAICAALLAACRGGASSNDKGDQGSTSLDPSKLPLSYVCGNQFKVQNYYPSQLSVTWSVTNSGDQGTLSLPAPPAGSAFSETVFTTRAIGTVILASGGVQLNSAANQQVSCAPPPPVVHVAVTPAVSTVPSSGTQQFAAQVTGTADTAVVWTVQEGVSGGAVDATGLYNAPAMAGTFHVVATSHADPTRSASATVTVQLNVQVTPATITLAVGRTQGFTAQVTGSTDTAVSWSVQEYAAGGSVDSTGLYTAPDLAGTFHVVARSHADPTRAASATVTVKTQILAQPAAADVLAGGTQRFAARVYGSADTGVIWSVQEGASGGAVDPTGLYTAPATAGTFHVVATSRADSTRSARINVTVQLPQPPTAASQLGQWDAPRGWPVVSTHIALLRDGRVLAWSRLGSPNIWDPSTDTFLAVPAPSWIFCAGQTFMPDGKLIVPGGHIKDDFGLPDVNVFDPATSSWIKSPPMADGRWYPTTIELADGSILVVAGDKADSSPNTIPEVLKADGTWRELTGASLELPFYPSLFLAPDGRVFMAGSDRRSRFLDTQGIGRWIDGPISQFGIRDYGAALMYAPGKIILAGGGWAPTDTAEVIDLNKPSPAWRFTKSMAHARRMNTGTLLPDGKVLVTGGTNGTGFNDESSAVFSAELWDPATEVWTELSSMRIPRVYHSVALLLPDARVLIGGGGEGAGGTDEPNIEMFSPPYLFNPDGSLAVRPGITSTPEAVTHGASFSISSPDAAGISAVTLVRLGAITHTFNTSQLRVPLTFQANADGTLTATAPADPIVAPPGHYMLFVVNAHGVPSVARILRLDLHP